MLRYPEAVAGVCRSSERNQPQNGIAERPGAGLTAVEGDVRQGWRDPGPEPRAEPGGRQLAHLARDERRVAPSSADATLRDRTPRIVGQVLRRQAGGTWSQTLRRWLGSSTREEWERGGGVTIRSSPSSCRKRVVTRSKSS